MTGPTVHESLEATSRFYDANPRTPAGPSGVDDLAGAARPRPVGDPGTVEWVGDVYPAIRSRLDGETYAAFYEHRDDWHLTTLPFVDLPEGEHSVWCDRGELDDACLTCQRTAYEDVEVES